MTDTIVGISTPYGVGAVGIIRLSGDRSLAIADSFFKAFKLEAFLKAKPNYMYLGVFDGGTFSDRCLAVYFKAPYSYTGEDIVEIQCHGGIRLTGLIFNALASCEGVRVADNGEFTKRAFFNNKLKLTDAEGVSQMIEANSEVALSSAYRMMTGAFYRSIEAISEQLLHGVSILEAGLDYPEEMEKEDLDKALPLLLSVKDSLKKLLGTKDVGRYVKEGISVAIVGKPNVGKSSLLNAILGRERAIVSPTAGTTRDVVSESIVIDGVRINLLDTAGLHDSVDEIEAKGIELSYESAKGADVILLVTVGDDDCIPEEFSQKRVLTVRNKSDIYGEKEGYNTCCLTSQGIDTLLGEITALAKNLPKDGEVLTNARHIKCVEEAFRHIDEGISAYEAGTPLECVLIDFRAGYNSLLNLMGVDTPDRIIEELFKSFCVGK